VVHGIVIILLLRVFRVHTSKHSSSGLLIVVNWSGWLIFLTVDLIHEVLICVTVLLQMLWIHLSLHASDVVCDSGKSSVVSVNGLNDFIRIRWYALQVVDLRLTHLDTYCDVWLCLLLPPILLLLPYCLPMRWIHSNFLANQVCNAIRMQLATRLQWSSGRLVCRTSIFAFCHI